jgi:hypothetical protein
MMSLTATGFEHSTDPRRALWANGVRRVLWRLLAALDRLVPPSAASRESELPPEWFKYPPF